MEDMSCKVCFNDFGKEESVPKVLECRHSLCSKCLATLLQNSCRNCPTCRKEIEKINIGLFPTNFELLGLSNSCQTLLMHIQKLQTSITNIESEFVDKAKHLEDLNKIKESENVKRQEFMGEFKKPEPTISTLSVTLSLDDFLAENKYLYEIYRRVQKGEEVYAVQQMKNEVKYGKIGVLGSNILVHSLSTAGDERVKNVTTVWFQDVKLCVSSYKYYPFLEICCNEKGLREMAMIEVNESPWVLQFVKLCTGEFGPSYKGSSYVKGQSRIHGVLPILHVPKYMHYGREKVGPIDFVPFSRETTMDCVTNEFIVSSMKQGCFEIHEITSEKFLASERTIGKIIPPCALKSISYKNSMYMKIVDCGFAITLN